MAELNEQDPDGTGLDRRKLLKGAVAAGVGVAAWSTPSISALGGTPAYASSCTAGFTTYVLNVRNTDCGPCPNGGIRYKDWTTNQCPIDNYPFSAALANSNCSNNVPSAGVCHPSAGVCVGGTPAGQTCVLRAIVQQNNCDGTILRSAVSAQFTGGPRFVQLPFVSCTGIPGSLFARIEILCSTEPECLPTS
jgi:hypothetical protein